MTVVVEADHVEHLRAIDTFARTSRPESFFAWYLASRDAGLVAAMREAAAIDPPVRSIYERTLIEARARLAGAIATQRGSDWRNRSGVAAQTVAWLALCVVGIVGADGPSEAEVAKALSFLAFGN
jgi:hypothetical protein